MGEVEIPEPQRARPWRPQDGPEPKVTAYPAAGAPALGVWSHGRWRCATVGARQDWADGRIFYQVTVDLDGSTTVRTLLYQWPQPGLRAAQPPRKVRAEASMPTVPPRPSRKR